MSKDYQQEVIEHEPCREQSPIKHPKTSSRPQKSIYQTNVAALSLTQRTHFSFLIIRAFPGQMPILSTIITTTTTAPASTVASTSTSTSTTAAESPTPTSALVTIPRQMPKFTAIVALTATATITSTTAVAITPPASSGHTIFLWAPARPPITTAAAAPPASTATSSSVVSGAAGSGEVDDVDGFGAAVLAELDDELDGLALGEGTEAVGLDRGLVDEEILAAVLRGYETEALLGAEPLDRAGGSRGLGGHGERSRRFCVSRNLGIQLQLAGTNGGPVTETE